MPITTVRWMVPLLLSALAAATTPALAAPDAKAPARSGPGTQTEDDIYIGRQGKAAADVRRPPAPNAGRNLGDVKGVPTPTSKAKRSGGDEDLEDLEVERNKAKRSSNHK